ncbi:adenylate kinase [Bacterioplanes sanyensis]|uniref:AAA family ATPase n=1 Tax=Bacterioplanes sanyensis TaxID=1249553 RepID=UPI00167B1900|nr:AAA family ATPase [Bacterioplanes sanyensis]GGY58216.1 adenylate kinase [Bacterioplanes sanyensis]
MRILITGAAGSGTTTLGKAFACEYGWNFLDADDFYWLPTSPPFQQRRDHSERLTMMMDSINSSENVVISGSVMNWGRELEDGFDLIVFLYLDAIIRVERLKKREQQRHGRAADAAFLQWASEYDSGPSEGRSLAKHQQWLSERRCPIIKMEGDLSVAERLQTLTSAVFQRAELPS